LVFVYPGDIDNNGIVDEQDILPIGLYFMENAHVRDTITFSWAPHQNLSSNHPVVLAITYADANGDGTVDEKDVIGIGVNWGNIHTNNKVSYCINPENKTLINVHREAFERLYYSLSGESEAVRSMKHLLESILDLNVPRQFSLSQNCPNPFNPKTKIQFALPEDQNVTLKVYNLLGKEVKVLIDHQPYETGIHTISLNEEDLASGVYIYRIVTEKWNTYRKMLVVK
jgi:hypothetical protein